MDTPQEINSKTPRNKTMDLDQHCTIWFENKHLSDVIDYIVEACGINVVMDPRVIAPKRPATPPGTPVAEATAMSAGYATDGMVGFVKLEDVPLGRLLTALLRPMNLEYRPIGHVIFISTPENLEKAKPEPPNLESGLEAIAKGLNANVSVEFETQELHGILDYVREYIAVDCHIDPEAKLPGTDQPATQATVSYIRLEDVPLWEALYWMTAPLGLTFTARDDTVWITTPDRMAMLPPALHILDIQKAPQGGYTAQIRYGLNSPIWYVEGEKFEDYTVQKVDAEKKEVTIAWDNNTKTMQLYQD